MAPEPPSSTNAFSASSAVVATTCRGMGAPAAARSSLAWYSWIFIGGSGGDGGVIRRPVDPREGRRHDGKLKVRGWHERVRRRLAEGPNLGGIAVKLNADKP